MSEPEISEAVSPESESNSLVIATIFALSEVAKPWAEAKLVEAQAQPETMKAITAQHAAELAAEGTRLKYHLLFAGLVVVVMSTIAMTALFQGNSDLPGQIITGLIGFAGGYGIGRSTGSTSTKTEKDE